MEVSPIYVVLGLVGAVLAFTVWIVMSPTDEGVPLRPPAAAAAEAAVPVPLREFTVEELAAFDGKDGRDLYVAVKGDVFDMFSHPSGRDLYGPGSGYNVFAGRDASVGLGMMEIKPENWKASVKDLTASEYDVMVDWHTRFDMKYKKVGTLVKQ